MRMICCSQLEQMELEVQSMVPELKSKYANRVRSYQVELKRLKQEYVSLHHSPCSCAVNSGFRDHETSPIMKSYEIPPISARRPIHVSCRTILIEGQRRLPRRRQGPTARHHRTTRKVYETTAIRSAARGRNRTSRC